MAPQSSQCRRKRRLQCENVESPSPTPKRRCVRVSSRRKNPAPSAPELSNLSESKQSKSQKEPEDVSRQPEQSSHTKESFPFLDLPPELRVNVYRQALRSDGPLRLHLPRGPEEEEDPLLADIHTGILGKIFGGRTQTYGEDTNETRPPQQGINAALLRTCSLVYKEARQVLYAENAFVVNLESGIHTLSSLHQRNRSLIKHAALTVPTHHDILDGFADVIRLGLRYCWGLKTLTISLPCSFPDDRYVTGTTNVYANAFHILRWLPKGCRVDMDGTLNDMIKRVVETEGRLMITLDDVETEHVSLLVGVHG